MSAKWRRSRRNTKRFNIFKAFGRIKNRNTAHASQVKNLGKRRVHPSRYGTPKTNGGGRMREPEPLIDILEEKGEIIVVAEFVGFSRENLRINVKNQRLTLSAETPNRKYYKSLNLPKRVIPNAIRTTYKNGVLEIQLKKAVEEKTIDRVAG